MSPTHEHRHAERLFLAITLTLLTGWGLSQIFYGERVPAGDGQGWDGRAYTWLIQDFDGVLLGGKLDSYRLQRILPATIVRAALAVGGVATGERQIVRAFAFLNLAAMIGTLLVWNGIARALQISIAGRWLGFLLFFVNFGCLKAPFYIPERTDHTALFLGALLLYGHVRDSAPLMGGGALLGAFTWPSFLVLAGLLLVMPRQPLGPAIGRSRHWLVGGALATLLLLGLAAHVANPVPFTGGMEFIALDRSLLPISAPLAATCVFLGFGMLAREPALFGWRTYRTGLDSRRLALWSLIAASVVSFVTLLSSGQPPPQTVFGYLRYLAVQPVLLPGLAFLSHVVYLGLLPLLLLFYWPRVCAAAHQLGLGLTLFVAALLAQSLTAESRLLSHGLAAMVLLAVLAVERVRWPREAPWLLGAMALVASKAWFPINHQGFGAKSDFLSYPAQYFYMNYGLWMSREMYALQGACALVGALLLALLVVRGRELGAEERSRIHPDPLVLLRACRRVLALALAALVVEGAARQLLRRQRAARIASPVTQPDPRLGWVNSPGAEARLRIGGGEVFVRFNDRGLRGPDYGYAKPPGVVRVLLLGGSAAEGYAVAEPRSVRAALEARLNALGCGHFEVINGGVAGYDTAQQAQFFALEGARYGADLVLLLFSHEDMLGALGSSDAEPNDPDRSTPSRMPRDLRLAPAPPLYEWRSSAALRLISNASLAHATPLHRMLASVGLVERGRPPRALWPFGLREESELAREVTEHRLAALAADVRSRGARFAVAYAPSLFEVDDQAWERLLMRYRMSPRFWTQQRVARRVARAAGLAQAPLLDLREPFARRQAAGARLYFPEEGLWTEAGHALAADAVASWLKASLCPPFVERRGG